MLRSGPWWQRRDTSITRKLFSTLCTQRCCNALSAEDCGTDLNFVCRTFADRRIRLTLKLVVSCNHIRYTQALRCNHVWSLQICAVAVPQTTLHIRQDRRRSGRKTHGTRRCNARPECILQMHEAQALDMHQRLWRTCFHVQGRPRHDIAKNAVTTEQFLDGCDRFQRSGAITCLCLKNRELSAAVALRPTSGTS